MKTVTNTVDRLPIFVQTNLANVEQSRRFKAVFGFVWCDAHAESSSEESKLARNCKIRQSKMAGVQSGREISNDLH